MAFFSLPPSLSLLNSIAALSLTLLTAIILSYSPFHPYPSPQNSRRSLLSETTQNNNQSETLPLSCSSLRLTNGLINYISLHFCLFKERSFLSIPCLSLFILLQFYVLIKTAQSHFSVVTTKLTHHLNLSPSMGGVTLLALGNGAPDVFASLAAVRSGQYRTGFGAILSAGTFVSAFVVGFVAIYAAPFNLDPGLFVRDVGFYLVAALFLFYVYLSGEISFWQAVGFVGFYVFFVGFVFWMDLGIGSGGGSEERGKDGRDARELDRERGGELVVGNLKSEGENSSCLKRVYGKVSPITLLMCSLGSSCNILIKMTPFCSHLNATYLILLVLYVSLRCISLDVLLKWVNPAAVVILCSLLLLFYIEN